MLGNIIKNLKNTFKKNKTIDFYLDLHEQFNYKFNNIDIIILNQFKFKEINIDLLFNNENNNLLIKFNYDYIVKMKPKKIYKKSYEIKNETFSEHKNEKIKINEYFEIIEKQSQNIVLIEKILNKIYKILYNYNLKLKEQGKPQDNYYKYNYDKMYKYCIKYEIKLNKIKNLENLENLEKNIKNEKENDISDIISEDFFNIFGENLKK